MSTEFQESWLDLCMPGYGNRIFDAPCLARVKEVCKFSVLLSCFFGWKEQVFLYAPGTCGLLASGSEWESQTNRPGPCVLFLGFWGSFSAFLLCIFQSLLILLLCLRVLGTLKQWKFEGKISLFHFIRRMPPPVVFWYVIITYSTLHHS